MIRPSMTSICIAVAGGCFGFPSGILAQLPSESMLPGQRPSVVALPDESRLPPGFAVAPIPIDDLPLPVVGGESPPPAGEPSSRAGRRRSRRHRYPANPLPVNPLSVNPLPGESLPGESLLPPAAQKPAVPEDAEDAGEELGPAAADVLNLAQSADAIAWLRLEMKGHVGPLRALAFTGDSARLCSAGEDKAVLVLVAKRPSRRLAA